MLYDFDGIALSIATSRGPVEFDQADQPSEGDVVVLKPNGKWGYAAVSSDGGDDGGGTEAAPARIELPYLAPPPTVNAWDLDAATMTDPDLLTNGWTIELDANPYTALTRTGDIELTSAPTASTYRSTLTNGVLLLQLPDNTAVKVYRETSGAYTYKGHVWGAVGTAYVDSYLIAATEPHFVNGTTRQVQLGTWNGGSKATCDYYNPGSNIGAQYNISGSQFNTIKYLHDSGSGSYQPQQVQIDGTPVFPQGGSPLGTPLTLDGSTAVVGFLLVTRYGQLVHLDFIRRQTLLSFP